MSESIQTIQSTIFAVESRSPRETKAWGRRLASMLEGGELLALVGDLGVGKTCFIKGLAHGLNMPEEQILSPTFTMIQEHQGRLPLYHIDLYRLETVELDDMGLREYLFSQAVAAVEWFERLNGAEQLQRLTVNISYSGANNRTLKFTGSGQRYSELVEKLKSRFG